MLAEERQKMLNLELAGTSRAEIARLCKRSKSLVSKVLGRKYPNKGRPKKVSELAKEFGGSSKP